MPTLPYVADKRPPFVRFENREYGRNHEASEAAGRPVMNLVDFALITPFGSKDCVEKPAVEWLKQIRDKAVRGEYDPDWVKFFELSYEEWKKGNELPREGTPVKTWALATRDVVNRLMELRITTVEDLAAIPDNTLGTIGLDGRFWRDQAKAWLDEAKDKGINARAIANANARIEQLEQKVAQLIEVNRTLREQVDESPKGRKKPEKEAA